MLIAVFRTNSRWGGIMWGYDTGAGNVVNASSGRIMLGSDTGRAGVGSGDGSNIINTKPDPPPGGTGGMPEFLIVVLVLVASISVLAARRMRNGVFGWLGQLFGIGAMNGEVTLQGNVGADTTQSTQSPSARIEGISKE
jgi:hypothetical protein